METPYRAGFNRGSADKLAGRSYDKSVPASHAGDAKSYRQGYRKGYKTTDASGAFGFSLGGSASASISTSPSGGGGGGGGGGTTLLQLQSPIRPVSTGTWVVHPVAIWTGPPQGAREAMLVRALRQAQVSGKPLLVSFFLRRLAVPFTKKALGDDELLAYGIVQSVSGDGYEGRRYTTKITSYGRYTPTGPAEGAPPADAPAVGSTFVIGSNDLASMVEYEAPAGDGFQAVLPEASAPTKPKWEDLNAALNDLDKQIAALEAAFDQKDLTAWGPKYDAFVKPWRATAAKIRTARTIANEYSDVYKAEKAILGARAAFALLLDAWNKLPLKPKTSLADKGIKKSGTSPFGEPAKEEPKPTVETKKEEPVVEAKKDEPTEALPPVPEDVTTKELVTKDLVKVQPIEVDRSRSTPLVASSPSWFEENWKWLAVGGLLIAGGGYYYMRTQRSY